jgi:hypothetical protein
MPQQQFNPEKVCKRASIIFNHYLRHPDTLQHMILYGPPGAGKTTTAEWFVNEFWRDYPLKQEVILILNAADERSLEAIRQKMYPFAEAHAMATSLYSRPKFIVLDECETLTETAQLALRPLLEYPTNELCLIFICNSLTRVQKQLMNHFLQIRFDPPITDATPTTTDGPTIDSIEWRNDYRKQNEIHSTTDTNGLTSFIHYLLSPPKTTPLLPELTYDLSRTLRWCILLAYELDINSEEFYDAFATLANPDNQTEYTQDLLPIQERLFTEIRAKFDAILPPI